MSGKPWSESDSAFLRQNYETLGASEVARALGRSLSSVYGAARQCGLSKKMPERLSASSISFIREHYPSKGAVWVSNQLGLPLPRVRDKICRMGLRLNKSAVHAVYSAINKGRKHAGIALENIRRASREMHAAMTTEEVERRVRRMREGLKRRVYHPLSSEQKKRISEKLTGRKNGPHSEETKQKIRKARAAIGNEKLRGRIRHPDAVTAVTKGHRARNSRLLRSQIRKLEEFAKSKIGV